MASTAASRASRPDADTLAETTRAWNAWFDGARRASTDRGIHGPYLVFAATRGATSNLRVFAGTPIPHLDQDSGQVVAGTWSLYALPVCVYERCSRSSLRGHVVTAGWSPDPSLTLPTDADLGLVLIRALSRRTDSPPTLGADNVWTPNYGWVPGELGLAVTAAVEQIGWRNTAAVIIAACGNGLAPAAEIAAILSALTAQPHLAGYLAVDVLAKRNVPILVM